VPKTEHTIQAVSDSREPVLFSLSFTMTDSHDNRVKLKSFMATCHTEKLWKEEVSRLPHGNDGLIFTPINSPYRAGTWDEL
jgi:hypothetical protein